MRLFSFTKTTANPVPGSGAPAWLGCISAVVRADLSAQHGYYLLSFAAFWAEGIVFLKHD